MSYEAPTLDEFVVRFPEFIEESSANINNAIAAASLVVDTGWTENSYKPAIMWLAAHILSQNMTASESLGSSSGAIESETIGRISVSYREGGTGTATLGETMYGIAFANLLRLNHAGPYLI